MKKPEKASTLLAHMAPGTSPELRAILTKVSTLQKLDLLLNPFLEEALQTDCKIANFENGLLTLIASNASFATRLRYQTPALLKKLKTLPDFKSLEKIRCIISLPPA